MKYLTDYAGVSHEGKAFDAVDGVVDIPDEHAGRFADLIAAGALVPIADDKPAKPGRKPKGKKAGAAAGAPADVPADDEDPDTDAVGDDTDTD